jgi:4-hydroxy-tetrahydrodipicolinate synthase
VLIGPEELVAEAVLLGAHGGVNGGSNLFPGLYSSMRRAASLGDLAMVRSLQGSIMAVRGAVYDPTYLPGLKCAAAALGLCTEVFAAPYAAVDAERRRAIREFVAGFAY